MIRLLLRLRDMQKWREGETAITNFRSMSHQWAGEYLITGQSRISAFGGGIGGYANGFARTEIDKITVKYFYE